jgi:hypothetical protein
MAIARSSHNIRLPATCGHPFKFIEYIASRYALAPIRLGYAIRYWVGAFRHDPGGGDAGRSAQPAVVIARVPYYYLKTSVDGIPVRYQPAGAWVTPCRPGNGHEVKAAAEGQDQTAAEKRVLYGLGLSAPDSLDWEMPVRS